MNITVPSYVSAPLILAAIFFTCLISVAGIKALALALKRKYAKTPEPEKPLVPTRAAAPRKKPRAVKSIEIDPDDVDKIYVRKSS